MQSFTVCFLLPLIFTVHAEVVTNFKNKCDQFFYKRSEPQVKSPTNDVHICQTFKKKSWFATLYDTANRIPVYSAYIYGDGNNGGAWEGQWFIEPQLENQNWDKNMAWEGDLKNKHRGVKMGKKQALDSDYKNVPPSYNRGHLNPNQHHRGDGSAATYTLTNIVPQDKGLNEGSWKNYETKVKNNFTGCNTTYVLVGAVPSKDKWVKKKNKNRINIPDYLWHAFCCVDNNGKFKTGAAAVRNENTTVVQCSIKSLKGFFEKAKSRIHQPFLNNCNGGTSIGDGDCASIVH